MPLGGLHGWRGGGAVFGGVAGVCGARRGGDSGGRAGGGRRGLTLREACLRAKGGLGDWPAERDLETRSMACGHLQRLADWGLIRATAERPTRYVIEPEWLGLR